MAFGGVLKELLPRQEDGVGASQRGSFENGNEWVLEAGFHGLMGWESELVLNEIIFPFKALQGLSTVPWKSQANCCVLLVFLPLFCTHLPSTLAWKCHSLDKFDNLLHL